MTLVSTFGAGCRVSTKTHIPQSQIRPALEATPDQLIQRFNQQAHAVRSLNAAVELKPVAGSAYSGVIEEYHEIRGFILAQRPSQIRMIGQAPVVSKNIFDMVSDGETFRIFIPHKNKFVVGPAHLDRPASKPIENLRPQHLLEAVFWDELPSNAVLFEEWEAQPDRFYVLTALRGGASVEIARKIWFDRADLSIARVQVYGAGGRLAADILYSAWEPVSASAAGATPADPQFPRRIEMRRPHEDYSLDITVTKITLNEEIAAQRFRLEQPPGTELVRVTPAGAETKAPAPPREPDARKEIE